MIGDEDMNIAQSVIRERMRQDAKWGEQSHQDGTGHLVSPLWDIGVALRGAGKEPRNMQSASADEIAGAAQLACGYAFRPDNPGNFPGTWAHILLEEVFEALAEENAEKLEHELEQVSAVAQAWIRDSRRRRGADNPAPGRLLSVRMLTRTLNYDRGQLGTIDPDAMTDRGLVWVEFGVHRQWSHGESESTGCWCSPIEYEVVPA